MITVLQEQEKHDMLHREPTSQQILKFIRRLQALPDGRHEIIITIDRGLRDWTVRPIGKVEK